VCEVRHKSCKSEQAEEDEGVDGDGSVVAVEELRLAEEVARSDVAAQAEVASDLRAAVSEAGCVAPSWRPRRRCPWTSKDALKFSRIPIVGQASTWSGAEQIPERHVPPDGCRCSLVKSSGGKR